MNSPVDWIELRNGNFYCVPAECWLDPSKPARRAIVSHAHADHFPKFGGTVWASPETIAIGKARQGKMAAKQLVEIPWGTPFPLGEVIVSLWPAGHILGSAQILLEYKGQRVLFSGDFSLSPNATCRSLAFPPYPIDLLICESTFGLKESHPNPEEELKRELENAGLKPLVIGAYSLGKTQRLCELIHRLDPTRAIMVQPSMAQLNRVYENFGQNVGKWQIFRKKEAKTAGNKLVQIVTPAGFTGFAGDRTKHKLLATGWDRSHKFPWMDGALDISDHASAQEIMAYIEKLQPKEIWFWHGYPDQLIKKCAQLGIKAISKKDETEES